MSANKTANYHLNQWEPEDKVLREEFNEDNKKIEDALTALAAADATESAARKVLETSITSKGNCTIEMFTYSGTDANPTTINFPRRPFAFIVIGFVGLMIGWGGRNTVCFAHAGNNTAVWNGNQLQVTMNGEASYRLNSKNNTYYVTAFYTN